jgi:hypothetical protein
MKDNKSIPYFCREYMNLELLFNLNICYTTINMSTRNKQRLKKAYSRYASKKHNKRGLAEFFRGLMPEIIFRTTKLEGEKVSRKMVSSLFK